MSTELLTATTDTCWLVSAGGAWLREFPETSRGLYLEVGERKEGVVIKE